MNNAAVPSPDDTAAFLARIRIATPCPARWEDMKGDARVRFCQQCSKHVYNFSAMTGAKVVELVREKEGDICGRFYRRADGTLLTADCPTGLAMRASRRLKKLACAMALAVCGAVGWATLERSLTAWKNRFAGYNEGITRPSHAAQHPDSEAFQGMAVFTANDDQKE